MVADPSPTGRPIGIGRAVGSGRGPGRQGARGLSSATAAESRSTRTSVTDDAISRIKHMILTEELAPGDRLPPEGELAAHLGLSRTSLREAVRALTFLGVIDTRQGDGTYVTSLGPELLMDALCLAVDLQREEALVDLVGVRRILEPAATAAAAVRITESALDQLREWVSPAMSEQPAARLVDVDLQFHRLIAQAAGNVLLVPLLDGLAAPTVRMRIWRGLSTAGSIERTLAEHRTIVSALESRDPELARAAATVHIAGVETWVRSLPAGWSADAARTISGAS